MKTTITGRLCACVAMTSALAVSAWANTAPTVTNIMAAQRTDGSKLVDIGYDLADVDGDPCTVSVLVSDDGGSTWDVPAVSMTGDVGAPVTPGAGKVIVWDAGADVPGAFGTNYKVRVCADDGQGPGGDMVLIPGGTFDMGDSFNEGWSEELPVHSVNLSPYYIDKYEVTKAFWDTVRTWATSNGYDDLIDGSGQAADHPVHSVNWYDCVKWCNARSQQEGRTPCYYTDAGLTTVYKAGEVAPYVKWDASGYRLPTEAEWEKAARGGTPGHRFPWSDTDTIQHARANYYSCCFAYDTSPTSANHPCWGAGSLPYSSPVGFFTGALQYKADWGWPGTPTSYQTTNSVNGYGLYDMAGNVFEWCNDWWSPTYYWSSPGSDPTGPPSGSPRVLRGGDWRTSPEYCRSANRYVDSPDRRYIGFGFRCVLGSLEWSRTGMAVITVAGSASGESEPDSGSSASRHAGDECIRGPGRPMQPLPRPGR